MAFKPQVVVKLQGGIGNLLFQFAAGQDIVKTKKMKVAFLESRQGERIRLESFVGLDVDKAPRSLTRFVMSIPSNHRIERRILVFGIRAMLRIFRLQIEIPPHDSINWSEVLPSKLFLSVGLNGYFQVPQSINTGIESVLDCLERTLPFTSSTDVILHLRRGDYVSIGWALDESYYTRAINRLELSPGSRIQIVGDDSLAVLGMASLVESLGFDPVIFRDQKRTALEDFVALSSCRIQILSNSTFSWWAAALATRRFGRDGVTQIAPDTWNSDRNSIKMLMPHWTLC